MISFVLIILLAALLLIILCIALYVALTWPVVRNPRLRKNEKLIRNVNYCYDGDRYRPSLIFTIWLLFLLLIGYVQSVGVLVGYGRFDFNDGTINGSDVKVDVYWSFTDSWTVPNTKGVDGGIWYYEPFTTLIYFDRKYLYNYRYLMQFGKFPNCDSTNWREPCFK